MSTDLNAALLEELRLRSRLNALVHERAEAIAEADRLEIRGGLDGADAGLLETALRWRTVATRVSDEIEGQRAALRTQEAVVARLRGPGEPA